MFIYTQNLWLKYIHIFCWQIKMQFLLWTVSVIILRQNRVTIHCIKQHKTSVNVCIKRKMQENKLFFQTLNKMAIIVWQYATSVPHREQRVIKSVACWMRNYAVWWTQHTIIVVQRFHCTSNRSAPAPIWSFVNLSLAAIWCSSGGVGGLHSNNH